MKIDACKELSDKHLKQGLANSYSHPGLPDTDVSASLSCDIHRETRPVRQMDAVSVIMVPPGL